MGRIISYSEKTGYNDGDYLLLDNGEGGTKRIRADRVGIQLDPTLTDHNKAAPANAVKPVDAVPTQGSNNAVSSGGVYEALHNTDTTLTQSGQAADAKVVGDEIEGIKTACPNLVGTEFEKLYYVGDAFSEGDYLTFSTSDGAPIGLNPTQTNISYYNENGVYIDYNGFGLNMTSRTVGPLSSAMGAAKYLAITGCAPRVPIMVNVGSTALPYKEHYEPLDVLSHKIASNKSVFGGAIDTITNEPITVEIGVNRYLSNTDSGTIVINQNTKRASTVPRQLFGTKYKVHVDPTCWWSINISENGTDYTGLYTHTTGDKEVVIPSGYYMFIQVGRSVDPFPEEFIPVSLSLLNITETVIDKFGLVENEINGINGTKANISVVDASELLWDFGSLNADGTPSITYNRCRTTYFKVGKNTSISANTGYSLSVHRYSLSGLTHIEYTTTWVDTYTVPEDCYVRIAIKKGQNADLSNYDPEEVGANCTVNYKTPYSDNRISVSQTKHPDANYENLLSQARHTPTVNARVLTLMHFSDIHDNKMAMLEAMKIMDAYSNKIDDAIHTGDVVRANFSDGLGNWINSGCAESVISVIGNHDSEENLALGTAGKETVYTAMLAPYISNWNVVQPTGVDDSTSADYCACYYYKDYSSASIRLIVLDTNWWDAAQKTWLTSVLADALTNNYSVILACHTPRFVTGMTEANFCSYTEPVINEPAAYANIPNDWLDPVNDFITNGGEVICMLAGHNHRDHFGYLTNYPRILCITADKASIARTVDTARVVGENNANAFNIITFNTTDKWIKIVRIGAEVDGQMRGKHVFCYDYGNKRIVSQW